MQRSPRTDLKRALLLLSAASSTTKHSALPINRVRHEVLTAPEVPKDWECEDSEKRDKRSRSYEQSGSARCSQRKPENASGAQHPHAL